MVLIIFVFESQHILVGEILLLFRLLADHKTPVLLLKLHVFVLNLHPLDLLAHKVQILRQLGLVSRVFIELIDSGFRLLILLLQADQVAGSFFKAVIVGLHDFEPLHRCVSDIVVGLRLSNVLIVEEP